MQNILLITITPTKANRSLFTSESKEMLAIEDTITTTIKKFNGSLFSNTQKEFYSSFTNDLILSCAIELFDLLIDILGTKNIRTIKISLGEGTTLKIGSHLIGPGVLQAQRINNICPPGQILLSKNLYSSLPPLATSNIYDYGHSLLIDLETPIHLIGTTSNAEINPTRITDKRFTYPTNLPTFPTPLISRSSELRDLKNLLLDHRSLTITGPAGTGKSRIGLHVGAECHKIFNHGVYYITFNNHLDLNDQIFQLSTALGFVFSSNEEIEEQLFSFLRTKKVLIIADCNSTFSPLHISFLETIIQKTTAVRVLALARSPLGIKQETIYTLNCIEKPKENPSITDLLYSSHAVSLYLTHALYMYPDLPIQKKELHDIVEICSLLKGNPQAIIMAAAWSKTLKVSELHTTLQELIPDLEEQENRIEGFPSRNNQLRAMFEATLQNLNKDEYEAFIRLSIFTSPFSPEDAQKAAGVSEAMMTRLYHKSPLQKSHDRHFFMHKVFKRIAYEELLASPFLNAIHETFYHHYMEQTYKVSLKLYSAKQNEALTFFENNKENIIASWHLCLNNATLFEIEKCITPLFEFIDENHLYVEGASLFEPFKNTLENPSIEPNGFTRFCSAKIITVLGTFHMHLNNSDIAHELFTSAIDIWTSLLEQPDSVRKFKTKNEIQLEYARTSVYYGDLLRRDGNATKSITYSKQGLSIFDTLNNTTAIAWVHTIIGSTYLNNNAPTDAIEHFKLSLTNFKYSNYPAGIQWAQKNLAHCYYNSGNFTEAQKFYTIHDYEKSIDQKADTTGMLSPREKEEASIENLFTLAQVHHEMGNYVKALHLSERTLILSSEHSNSIAIADSIFLMATIHASMGNYKKSKTQLQECLGLYQSLQSSIGVSKVNLELARLHLYTEMYTTMNDYLKHIDTQTISITAPKIHIDYQNILGLYSFYTDVLPLAEEAFKKAHTESAKIQYENGTIRSLKNLSKLELASGNTSKALFLFSEIIQTASHNGILPVILESMLDITQILIETKDFEYAMDILIYIYNHKSSNAYTRKCAKKKLFKMPPKYGKQFFFYCINNEEHRDIKEFSASIISNIEIAIQHTF